MKFTSVGAVALALVAIASAPVSAAEEQAVEIIIKNHKFEPATLKVPASTAIKLTVKNLDSTAEEFESHKLGVEKVIAGNGSAIVRIKPLKAGTYGFFGEYHEATAQGQLVAE
jgi:plastocyanin